MSGLTLDTGALIALERGVHRVVATLRVALRTDRAVAIPAGALAQAWRGGPRQAVLARLLRSDSVTVVPLDERRAMSAGVVCARSGTSDVVDASVVLCARARGGVVLTSDPGDHTKLDPALTLVIV